MVLNKKGYTTISLVLLIIFALVLMIILVATSWGFSLVDDSLSQLDFNVTGNTTFNGTYQTTLRPGIIAMETTVPVIISSGVLLGMVLSLMLVGYNMKKISRLWVLLDIAFIILATAVASLVSSNYTTFINSDSAILIVAGTTLSAGSKYIVNLPLIIPIVGVLVMLATHLITREKEEQPIEF